jgi:predicted MPP superfamily phosphohydrolase
MWFVLLGIALSVVVVGGLYFRWHLVHALGHLGFSSKVTRRLRRVLPYLFFGYPVLVFLYVIVSMLLGRDSFSIEPDGILLWVLVIPFWMSILIMLQSLPFFLLLDAKRFVDRRLAKQDHRSVRHVLSLLVVCFFTIYTPTRILWSRADLNVHRYQLGQGTSAPFRIAFVGDLQRDSHTDADRTTEVIEKVNAENTDLVLFGGDWINSGSDYIEEAAKAGSRFQSRLGTYSVRGDHEHFAYRDQERSAKEVSEALERNNVHMINNEVRWFEHQGERIGVAFLSYNYIVRSPREITEELLAEIQGADYSILITHQFDEFLAGLAKDRVDLVLAAHTHGGQVNPLVGFTHVSIARVETRFVEGLYDLGQRTKVIVTAGIGFSIAPFRYASPAGFEVLELRL